MNTSEKCKPCPFCGGEQRTVYMPMSGKYYGECVRCFMRTRVFNTEDELMDYWNRRTPCKER